MTNTTDKVSNEEFSKVVEIKLPKCGIVMPISPIDNCSADHWNEVQGIIKDCVGNAGFEPNLVSDADDSGIIQKRIIHNLYSNEIVVCDVSGKNPNVMFELGMRLAFDKPTIIIKDDKTDYSFDTSIIEHLTYPRDLRFNRIVLFKEALKKKVQATYSKSINEASYTTFLKHFGEYKVAQLSEKEVTSEKYIVSALDDLRQEMIMMRRSQQMVIENNRVVISPRRQRLILVRHIEEFMKENNIKEKEMIYLLDKESELFEYLERLPEVREICANRRILKELMMSIINPDQSTTE